MVVRADLHHASRTGDRLRYPPLRPYHSIVATGRHLPDVKAKSFAEKLGSGIQELENSVLSADVCNAMWNGVEAVVALDHYRRYENNQPRLVDVMLAANEAQRDFLELTPQEGLGLEQLVNNCCRLTALVSLMLFLHYSASSDCQIWDTASKFQDVARLTRGEIRSSAIWFCSPCRAVLG